MIGRFSHLGTYSQLLQSSDFYKATLGGLLALSSYVIDKGHDSVSTPGITLAVASLAINGLPIIWRALKGLLHKEVNVDELVSLAIIASIFSGEFLAAAVVSFVMVLGSLIEAATSDSARKAIAALIKISPNTAHVLINDEFCTIPITEVKTGNILLVKPGDRIPVDGTIIKGITAVDESSMTGEPIPGEKKTEDTVFAGTLNQNGTIEIEATKVGEDTTLGKIIKLVAEAEAHKPHSVRLIDRYARWFTPAMLTCAGITWFITGDMSRAIAVLIVGCPCALILAAPTAIVATIGRAAKLGILVKGGIYLEDVARADVVLFDKTGTLTEGKPRVDKVVAVEGMDTKELLACAASVEQNSTHPLANAIIKAACYAKVAICCAEEMIQEIGLGVRACVNGKLVEVGNVCIGGGIECLPVLLSAHLERSKECGATPLVVYHDKTPVGVISVMDRIRPTAKEMVEKLKILGIKRIGILSGDHEKSARLVANTVCLTDAWSELKPQDKLMVIKNIQQAGSTLIFVGDGINDAPALAAANVGIAMGAAGTDVALETADIALMNDDISKIPFLIQLSRRMLRVIKWNIMFGLTFNTVAVFASGWGLLTPIMGAVVHNIGSVLVVLSSASLAFASENKK